MTRETLTLLARRHLHRVGLSAFVDWAVFMLEAGYDTEHLRMLSILGSAPVRADIDYYFGQTLYELDWTVPPIPLLLRLYARIVAEEIVEGKAAPVEGCHAIYRVYLALDYPVEMQTWLYLDDGLEPETYQEFEGENLDKAIRQEARRLLETL